MDILQLTVPNPAPQKVFFLVKCRSYVIGNFLIKGWSKNRNEGSRFQERDMLETCFM